MASEPDGPDRCPSDPRRERRRAYWALARRLGEESARGRPRLPSRPLVTGRGIAGDDVEVGFPSVSTFVPRMRRAFFRIPTAPAEGTQQTEIALTARQATEGAQVPLDLTVRHTCPVCGGRGELWSDPCGICRGSGTGWMSHQLDLRVPPGVRHGSCIRFSVSPPYAAETHIEVRIAVN